MIQSVSCYQRSVRKKIKHTSGVCLNNKIIAEIDTESVLHYPRYIDNVLTINFLNQISNINTMKLQRKVLSGKRSKSKF